MITRAQPPTTSSSAAANVPSDVDPCVIDTVRTFDAADWVYEAACLREPHEGCVGDRVICRIPRDA